MKFLIYYSYDVHDGNVIVGTKKSKQFTEALLDSAKEKIADDLKEHKEVIANKENIVIKNVIEITV